MCHVPVGERLGPAMLLSLCVGLVVAMVTVPFAAVHSDDYLWVFVLVPLIAACFQFESLFAAGNSLRLEAGRDQRNKDENPQVIIGVHRRNGTVTWRRPGRAQRSSMARTEALADGDVAHWPARRVHLREDGQTEPGMYLPSCPMSRSGRRPRGGAESRARPAAPARP